MKNEDMIRLEAVMMQMNPQKQWERKTSEEKENERMKYEIAQELGLLDKVEQLGWKANTGIAEGLAKTVQILKTQLD